MTEEDKEKLRQLVRTHQPQLHFFDYWAPCDGDDWRRRELLPQDSPEDAQLRARHRSTLRSELFKWADPLPDVIEYITGIPSYNAKCWKQTQPVAQAVASRKMHYLTKLQSAMRDGPDLPFSQEFPDHSPASGGTFILQAHQ